MISLVIDTSVSNLFIGVVRDNTPLAIYNERVEKDLSSIVFEALDSTLNKANVDKKDINNIFVVIGPGSFTGVRIGVTIAKTYAWAMNIKVIPVSSLEFMISGYDEPKIPLIDARRGFVFSGKYDNELNSLSDDQYVSLDTVINNNVENYSYISFDNFDNIEVFEPKYDMLKLINKHINDEGVNPHLLNPKYLKLTEAEEKLLQNV